MWTFLFRSAIIKDNSKYFQEGVYYDDTTWLPQVLMMANRVDSMNVKRHFYLIRSDSLVRSVTPQAIRKKVEGKQFIIEELLQQTSLIHNENALKWYGFMLALCVLSLLSLVAEHEYHESKKYIKRLNSLRVFPISSYRLGTRNRMKAMMVNLSPLLFCRYIHSRSVGNSWRKVMRDEIA